MLFLVNGDVYFTPYMGSQQKPKPQMRLVEAETSAEAATKFEKYFSDMSVENDDAYWVSGVTVAETIV